MGLMAKMYIVGKINEWIRKRILEEEIVNKGKAGADKLQNILDDYVWDNIEKFVKSAKLKDNKFIPNFIEDFTEDIFEGVFTELREVFDLRNLLESILKEEKKAIGI
ncbi:hypothetical protein [Sebaldella sp. S0638]|uniref:hypothetical protein n=1 Tax=Sebaldella sp. S0638 TaxID=2957809 RepID=UPI00209CF47B|nr:hypothetical protein [Sebaldella sp. S0638]MCP1226350.1 hypothetical protein [Sebaldella sp. S0638]